MKKQFYWLFVIGCLMCMMGYAKQNTYPTMTENGKTYYLYTVQKSEGIYAISQRFSVPQSLIIEANPGVENGLKLGQLIKVPQGVSTTDKKNNAPVKIGKDQHVVKAKETLYGLSKKYNCTVDELLELNPWATHLTIGAVLQIPSKKVESQCKPSAETSSLDYAEAQPDFMSEANRVESQDKQKKNEKKNIWSWFSKSKEIADTTSVTTVDSVAATEDTQSWWLKQQESEIKVAILLPFMLDSLHRDASMDRFVEFYQGCLLAIDSLAKQGLSTEIYTYDIGKDTHSLQAALQEPALSNVDLIIGPAYQNQVKEVADFASKHRIPTVVPFSSSIPEITSNPYLFEVVTPQKELYTRLVQKFCYHFNDKNIIIVKPRMLGQYNKADFANQLMAGMDATLVPYTVISDDSIATTIDSLAALSDKECLVVLPSTHQVALNKFGEALHYIKSTNVSVFGFPEWNSMGINELYSKRMYGFSNYYTSFDDPQIISFFTQLKDTYGVPKGIQQSPNFALFGFDICYFFLQQYSENGKYFYQFMPTTETQGLQMNFLFEPAVKGGGYWNVGTVFQRIDQNGILNL
ncbi:MAG: LysM peptidoglycan-binding domain-containing protein [Paludibacteraceae bacterium]|nr:LysM peptidoglycan-binding domain-containing protein [Paludibacteraceae bacterium]